MKSSGNGKMCSKAAKGEVAKYNGVALPGDATQRRRLRNKLSAQVHRKRKQDALNKATQEAEDCDATIQNLKTQLDDTRAKISSMQSIMDAIKLEFGDETAQHILQHCVQEGATATEVSKNPSMRLVSSDSDANISSSISTSSDDESI
mmetsp:Transcript_14061/g.23970  ORF Transcript_14061/g.23970 Transcript_14061/m.23970 type:complete len:148 (-) Transcript_14061:283-726(-)